MRFVSMTYMIQTFMFKASIVLYSIAQRISKVHQL